MCGGKRATCGLWCRNLKVDCEICSDTCKRLCDKRGCTCKSCCSWMIMILFFSALAVGLIMLCIGIGNIHPDKGVTNANHMFIIGLIVCCVWFVVALGITINYCRKSYQRAHSQYIALPV